MTKYLINNPIRYVLVTVIISLLFLNCFFIDFTYLRNHSIDEWAFLNSFIKMYDGMVNFDLRKIYGFGFYGYGFGFFGSYFSFMIPSIYINDLETTLYIGRIINSSFSILTILFIYKILNLFLDKTYSSLLVILIISFPAFWFNAFWIHPDWGMIFLTTLSLYYLFKDNSTLSKSFYLSVGIWSLSCTFKIQAFSFVVLIFLYIIYSWLANKKSWKFISYTVIKSLLIFTIIFLLVNPYIIHPKGINALFQNLSENFESNLTNHGSYVIPTILDKLKNPISSYFINYKALILLITLSIYSTFRKFRSINKLILISSTYSLLWMAYLLINVNKQWNHYYLPSFILFPLLFVPIYLDNKKFSRYFLITVIAIQFISLGVKFEDLVLKSRDVNIESNLGKEKLKQISNNIDKDFSRFKLNEINNVLISPYLPFNFKQNNIEFKNVHLIFGNFQLSEIDINDYFSRFHQKQGFVEKDVIIISKHDIYFDDKISKTKRESSEFKRSSDLIKKLIDGELGYNLLSENQHYYLLIKNSSFNY